MSSSSSYESYRKGLKVKSCNISCCKGCTISPTQQSYSALSPHKRKQGKYHREMEIFNVSSSEDWTTNTEYQKKSSTSKTMMFAVPVHYNGTNNSVGLIVFSHYLKNICSSINFSRNTLHSQHHETDQHTPVNITRSYKPYTASQASLYPLFYL